MHLYVIPHSVLRNRRKKIKTTSFNIFQLPLYYKKSFYICFRESSLIFSNNFCATVNWRCSQLYIPIYQSTYMLRYMVLVGHVNNCNFISGMQYRVSLIWRTEKDFTHCKRLKIYQQCKIKSFRIFARYWDGS